MASCEVYLAVCDGPGPLNIPAGRPKVGEPMEPSRSRCRTGRAWRPGWPSLRDPQRRLRPLPSPPPLRRRHGQPRGHPGRRGAQAAGARHASLQFPRGRRPPRAPTTRAAAKQEDVRAALAALARAALPASARSGSLGYSFGAWIAARVAAARRACRSAAGLIAPPLGMSTGLPPCRRRTTLAARRGRHRGSLLSRSTALHRLAARLPGGARRDHRGGGPLLLRQALSAGGGGRGAGCAGLPPAVIRAARGAAGAAWRCPRRG